MASHTETTPPRNEAARQAAGGSGSRRPGVPLVRARSADHANLGDFAPMIVRGEFTQRPPQMRLPENDQTI